MEVMRCRYKSAQEVQQRFSRKYQDSSAGRAGAGAGAGVGEVLVQRCWCLCSDAGAEVLVQSRCRCGGSRQQRLSRGAEVLRC